MKVRIPILMLAFAALLTLAAPSAFAAAQTRTNPPSACDPVTKTCSCEEPSTVGAKCIKVNLDMGRTTPWAGSRPCALKVFADDQSPMVFTPESLFAVAGGYTFKRIGNRLLPDRETPRDVVLSHPNGESVTFAFNAGESVARPDPGVHVKMDERLQMTDAAGWACTNSPVYYDLYETDGTVRRFLATDRTGERGKLVSVTDSRGVRHTAADMGVDVVYGPDGVRQFLTPSRLADVRVVEDGYDVAVYAVSAPPAKGADGLYPLPRTETVKFLSIRCSNDGLRAVVTLRSGGNDPEEYVFDYAQGDWSLTRPSGVRETNDRSTKDSAAARIVHEVRSSREGLLSRDEMNYRWMSWGFAATNRVEGFGGVVRTTGWTYFTSGNGKGQVRTELKSSGLWTEYAYDAEGRVVSVKRSGPDMMTELVTYSYASVDPSDIVPPVDSRPRTVVKTLGGVECERTYYVYAALTDIVERVGTQGAAFGGTNALRTVTAHYPVVAGDVSSGRVRSIRREDGRLDLYDYALVTNVWTETVTHLHEQSPVPVSGRTTRDIRVTNTRGEVAEERTEAFIGGTWHVIARNRMAYNPEGKRVRTEDLAGRVTTTEWDCCHKVAETLPDGSTTSWDYDDEGRLVEVSRLIPLDLTNVTWLTTCYAYDDLGRQTASWTTNFAAHVGLPATTTRYDALGRVASRIDALGNATTTTYTPDGLTVSVHNPNSSTMVSARSPGGDLLSITGTAVTPEFRTYAVLPDGTRWSRTVQGATASSPRFMKRYENMLGQTIREERSGYRGAVLATVNAYDNYGRIISATSDGEPTTTYAYDDLGSRVATVRSVGGTGVSPVQWRRSETRLAYVLADGAVWQTQTNVTSCSDAAIAPLVTSQSLQLTALTADTPTRTRTTDIRGNLTESWTEQADGITTAKRRVPEATNIISSRSRFGVSLESVSVSAVTNTTVYDALGRVSASIDWRGNATRTEYDSVGRRSATIDAAGNPTRYAYDRFGNLIAITNALGNAIVYEYDLRGRKTYEGGATYPVRYTYDVFGNKTTMMTYRDESRGPGSGDVTTWFYDEASGVMTNKVYADGKGPRYDYDANGRLAKRTWARGIDTFYAYDGWGNLTNTTYSDDTPTVALWYDALGRQIEAHDAAGVTTIAYDAFGANTNETVVGVAGTNVLERFTDEFGRDAGYALNGERRRTVIGRDPATGRIETMLAAGCTNAFRWSYLPGCDLKHTLLYPNGALVTWEYESRRDLMTLVSNDVYSTFHYTYDEAGKRISKNDERYIYNVRGELVLATNVVTGAEFAYRYDDIGNRLWSREFGTNCTYVANELNQYTNIVRGGVFELSAFDLDGNQTNVVTSTGVWSVTYNGENRPVCWHRAFDDTTIHMAYDRMGRRVVRNDETFVYDNYLNIGDTVWDPTELIITRSLISGHTRKLNYNLHDAYKNVVVVVNDEVSTFQRVLYAPFGCVLNLVDVVGPREMFLFSNEHYDFDIGVSEFNFRSYSCSTGRWLTRDPIVPRNAESLYGFVKNRPSSIQDVLGLSPLIIPDPTGSLKACATCYDHDWYKNLPDCPCSINLDPNGCPTQSPDDSQWSTPGPSSHSGATWEIRSNPDASGHGQQCTYDSSGKLINKGEGAGTPDYISPNDSFIGHCMCDCWQFLIGTSFDHWTHPPNQGCDGNGQPCPPNDGSGNPPPGDKCCGK